MKIVVIDPGEHIGFIYNNENGTYGMTIVGSDRNKSLWTQLNVIKPDIIVYEKFALRANMANKLVGNKFITCEVIGVIKLFSQMHDTKLVELDPFVKEYCGFSSNPKDEHYNDIILLDEKISEHVRDAYRLFSYYKIFNKNKS